MSLLHIRRLGFGSAILLLVLLLGTLIRTPAGTYAQEPLAPTYRVFATREGLVGFQTANGHIIQPRDRFVALPSWKVLSSRGGYEYQVRVTYNGRSVVLPVWDVGPWNTNDAYWQYDRGDYPDLPVGMPQAEAAFYYGHNAGRDEFGRIIGLPNGIDIADGAFWDDLGMADNDWVTVSYLWLGADPGPGAAVQERGPVPADQPAPTAAPVPPPAPPAAPEPTPPPAAPEQPQPTAVPPTPIPQDSPTIPAGALAVDNSDGNFQRSGEGWQETICGVNGSHVWATSDTSDIAAGTVAVWTLPADAGIYEVQVYIPNCGDGTTTTAARYTVSHDTGVEQVTVDQAGSAGTWVSLGSYSFGRVSDPTLKLAAQAGDTGRAVRFDSVAWLPVGDSTPPQARITSIARERNGYRVQWGGSDDLSGIRDYDVQVRQLPDGMWRTWMRATERDSNWFGPDEGRQFAFRVRARDRAGNEQEWSDDGSMDTTQAKPIGAP